MFVEYHYSSITRKRNGRREVSVVARVRVIFCAYICMFRPSCHCLVDWCILMQMVARWYVPWGG
jgi:hypothetical protein